MSAESWIIMAVKDYLGVATTSEIKRMPLENGLIKLTANGISVKVTKYDWTMYNLNAIIYLG